MFLSAPAGSSRALAFRKSCGSQLTLGRAPAHGRASSICAERRKSVASSNGLPIRWTPIGSPLVLHHIGTEAAGCPVTLTSAVKGVQRHWRCIVSRGSSDHVQPISTGRGARGGG